MKREAEGFDIEDEEVFFEHSNSSPEDEEFDAIVTCLEEILMDDNFQSLLNSFYDKNCDNFEESKENKLEYTEIHNKYTNLIEKTLEEFLLKRIPNFTMKRFEYLISAKHDQLSGEVFDLLLTLADFMEFKDIMISHKNAKISSLTTTNTNNSSSNSTNSDNISKLDLSITGKGQSNIINNKKNTTTTNKNNQSNNLDLSISGKKY